MRTVALGLTAIALALTVVSCADGCSAHEAASSTPDPAAAAPRESGSATPPSSGSQAAPQAAEPTPSETVPEVPLEQLPHTKPEPVREPETIEGMKSASTDAPPLDEMRLARVSAKRAPPVDVRYLVSGVAAKDQPVTLQLAFVPRLDGRNLRVEFPDTAGIAIETGAKAVASPKASKSDVLRHTLLVTPTAADSGEVRAVISLDVGDAIHAGVVSIPVGDPVQKVASKKIPQG